MRIHPFQALRPPPEVAARVASVPYDTVDTDQARALADGNTDSFLRVTRPEVNLPPGQAADPEALSAAAVEAMRDLVARRVLIREDQPRQYVYRLGTQTHTQTGVVTCCHIDDYTGGSIRKHELTRPDKEQDRLQHILAVRAHTGPVFLTYRDSAAIDRICAHTTETAPLLDFTAADGVRHTIWHVRDEAGLAAAFAGIEVAYIADGHHRAAAAAGAGAALRKAGNGHDDSAGYNWFLAVLFGARQLRILPYNRLVLDLNGHTPERFLATLEGRFAVTPSPRPEPTGPEAVGMYLAGTWYQVCRKPAADGAPAPVFDAAALQELLLAPVLGIDEPRTSDRIAFVGGIHAPSELGRMVDRGRGAAAFLLNPVRIETLMATADAGGIMPPKSTWFEPKLRSGLLVHTLE